MRSISSSRADRNRIGVSAVFLICAADFEAVHLRHADVEHDEVVDVAVELAQRLLAVLRDRDRHAGLFEREAHDVADMRVIIDDENGMSHVALAFAALIGIRRCIMDC